MLFVVELGRMGFFFALALLLTAFSISQQQVCPPDNWKVKTVCAYDNMGSWTSNIGRAGGSSNGGRSYEVMWDRDLNLSLTAPGGYVVVYRQLGSARSTQALKPTMMNQGFTIMNLSLDIRYDAMVCLPGRKPPSNFELSPSCGNCRLCFGTSTQERTSPTIIKTTMQELPEDMGIIYECVALGTPQPNLIWSGLKCSTGRRQKLRNSMTGITISTQITTEVKSRLTILSSAGFKKPICIAGNKIDRVTQSMFLMVSPPTDNHESSASIPFSIMFGFLVPISMIVFLVVGIVVCICCLKYWKWKLSREQCPLRKASIDDKGEVNTEIPFLRGSQSLLQKLPNTLIISPSEIEVSAIIGQGEFGVIYKGILKSDMMNAVAIKTLRGIFATDSDIENLSQEIEKMQYFEHPNVMSLIGVCLAPSKQGTSSGGPCIVMPFMVKGSLLDQLRKESDEFCVASEEERNFESVKKVLLQVCFQIAKGMEYLAGLKFVHRDLAARNCLMDINGIIKVSDFGLAEDIYSQNYFREVQGGTKLPLKWMALESITQGKFTEKSDVWSYGITCWEVFTEGSIPYPGMHPRDVLDFLENGGRSARPKNAACDSDMYALMKSCWKRKYTSRPSFSDIVSRLSSNLEYTYNYLDLTGLRNRPSTVKVNAICSVDGPKPSNDISRFASLTLHSPCAAANDYYLASI